MKRLATVSQCPGAREGSANRFDLPECAFNPGNFFVHALARHVERTAMQRSEHAKILVAGLPRNQTGGCERLEPEWLAPYPGL